MSVYQFLQAFGMNEHAMHSVNQLHVGRRPPYLTPETEDSDSGFPDFLLRVTGDHLGKLYPLPDVHIRSSKFEAG